MKLLQERILKDARIREGGIIKVDSFLNHQMDIPFINEIGREFYRLCKDDNVTKILTIEASGIGIACLTAQYFNVPVVFAKKTQTKNLDPEVYTSKVTSYTHGRDYIIRVFKRYLSDSDRILIIDDFLAKGMAIIGLADIINQAGATLVGAGVCIEKAFQSGGREIRDRGIRLESLAKVDIDENNKIIFR